MTSAEQQSASFRPSAVLGNQLSPSAGHLPFAADLIWALKPPTIVELGVAWGDLYFGFCQLVKQRHMECSLFGIDAWVSNKGTKARGAFDVVSQHNSAHYQTFSRLLRKSFEEALSDFDEASISLLVLNGEQPFDKLKPTFDAWITKVKPGGVILLNNISNHGGASQGERSGASQLWNEVKASYPHFAFRHNNGLGVLARSPKDSRQIPFLADIFDAPADEQERIRRHYLTCAERLEQATRAVRAPKIEHEHTLFQVVPSRDSRYEADAELSHDVLPGSWVNLSLNLPDGVGDLPLRLDVADRPAVVDIAMLALRKEDGHTAWTWNPKDPAQQLSAEGTAIRMPEPEFFRVLALGADSHVFLPALSGEAFKQPLELEIRLRIDLELSALRRMTQQSAEVSSDPKKTSPDGNLAPVATESAVAKTKADSAKYLAQARIDHETKIRQVQAEAESRVEALQSELDSLRSRMESMEAAHGQDVATHAAQLAEERRSHQLTLLDRENLLAQQPRMLQEISIAQGNVEELKAEVERLSGDLANMEFDVSELRKVNARLTATLEEERSARMSMQESGSWQLTKPLRAVGDLFGPKKKY